MPTITYSAVDPIDQNPSGVKSATVKVVTQTPVAGLFRTADGVEVLSGETKKYAADPVNGFPSTVSLELLANADITPAGTHYAIQFELSGGFTRHAIVVPTGNGTHRLVDLLTVEPADSEPFVVGFTPAGTWDEDTTYHLREVVSHDGASYVARGTTTGDEPGTDEDVWQVVSERGEQGPVGPTPTLAPVATSGSASDLSTGTIADARIPASIARDAEVQAAIDTLIGGAPGTRDTLKEISDALSADEGALAALTSTVAGKQAADADLTALAALDSTTAGMAATDGAGWIKKTYAQVKTALGLAKADVGLGNVDNTSDANKPVSTAQATALAGKANTSHAHAVADLTTSGTASATTYLRGDGAWATPAGGGGAVSSVAGKTGDVTLAKGDVGLGNVDNTSDAAKPISTATQDALDTKASTNAARPKPAARVCATGNVTISGPGASIDSVTLVNGDRVLLVGQLDATQNGLWQFNGAGAALTRTTDADTAAELAGAWLFVADGQAQRGAGWELVTTGTVTPGTTPQTWALFAVPQPSAKVDVFTSSGTYTVPAGATALRVTVIGGGGGGAGGGTAPSGTASSGGGGGGGGGVLVSDIPATLLPATVPVTVGGPGAGGASQTSATTAAPTAGSAGGTSYFGTSGTSYGRGAPGGGAPSATAGSGVTGGNGGAGGNGAVGATSATPQPTTPTGGGGGGGISTAPAAFNGGAGQAAPALNAVQGAAGVAPGGAGGAGSPSLVYSVGGGGGGGASSTTGAGGAGGAGAVYGAGGGGGGAALTNNATGAGGAGASGLVMVVTYF